MNTRDETAINFYEAYMVVARRLGIFGRYESTDNLIQHYKKLANQCYEHGYSDYLVEFDNDISVRGNIEAILASPSLYTYDAFKQFQTAVAEIDMVMKASYLPDVMAPFDGSWWTRGIVRKGHGDYAADVKLNYGIELKDHR